MKKKKVFSYFLLVVFMVVMTFTACKKTAAVQEQETGQKKEEDLSWLDQSVENFNKQEYGRQVVTISQRFDSGTTLNEEEEYIIDRKTNTAYEKHSGSKDERILYYEMKGNVYDQYMVYGDEPIQVEKNLPIENLEDQTFSKCWKLDAKAEEFEFQKVEEIDGEKAVKVKYTMTVPEKDTVAWQVIEGGIFTDEQIRENEVLKRAIEENKKGVQVSYYWFDKKTHNLIQKSEDTTEAFIINYFAVMQQEGMDSNDNDVPQESVEVTKYYWPENHEPIEIPQL